MSHTQKSPLEAALAAEAARDLQVFHVLADLAEERGDLEAAAIARRLPGLACDLAARLRWVTSNGAKVVQLQATPHGGWTIFVGRPAPDVWPESCRGQDQYLGRAVELFDRCFPLLDALGAAVGFRVVESLRNQYGTVLTVRFAHA